MSVYDGMDVTRVLQVAMKTTERNHRLHANNIANADTPNYHPTSLNFQKTMLNELQERGGISLRKNRPRHLEFTSARPELEKRVGMSKNDHNMVDLDVELTKMTKNASDYGTYAQLMRKYYTQTTDMLQSLNR